MELRNFGRMELQKIEKSGKFKFKEKEKEMNRRTEDLQRWSVLCQSQIETIMHTSFDGLRRTREESSFKACGFLSSSFTTITITTYTASLAHPTKGRQF